MRLTILTTLIFATSIFSQNIPSNIKYLALGDSYTIGASVLENERWPNLFMSSLEELGYSIESNEIVATTGWTTTNLLSGINSSNLEKGYNLISILIGVNNFFQSKPVNLFKEELVEIIDSALVLANQDTGALFMLTIPDYGYTPFGASQVSTISVKTDLYNSIKDSIAKVFGIPLYDITNISRKGLNNPLLVAEDGLHPSGKQYGLWVDLLLNEMGITTSKNTQSILKTIEYSIIGGQVVFKAVSKGKLVLHKITGELIEEKSLFSGEGTRLNLVSGIYFLNFVSLDGIEGGIIIQP